MILVDTSAWVEYDRATDSPVDRRLTALIRADGPVAITEPVVMGVLAGARSDARERDLRRLLTRFTLLPLEPAADFAAAAALYRRCRRSGVTPRGLLDCLIMAVAWRTRAAVLHADKDMDRIAAVAGVDLDTVPAVDKG
ncbi:MAG: PIN domain nuclease [Austwickia sp.]|jgi:predicted nucleic acid-binding protein|nr:MAG: PIN domain nuclease [Austwickia sp.]